MPSFSNVKALLDYTGKLGKLKHGSTASALTHQKGLLLEAKQFPQWFKDLTEERQRRMLTACPELAKLCAEEGDLATLDDLENTREVKGAALNDYVAFSRESAVVWRAHLRKSPRVNLGELADPRKESWIDTVPGVTKNLRFEDLTATPTPAAETTKNDTLMKDAGVMKAAEKLFKGAYFVADVVPHATASEFRECFQAQDGQMMTTKPPN
ncbi:hypothetical protein CYMTET_56135 [Cymbomonas tetramitiformis]|uniref:Uncharacterized protein n=1 Tax=Cymbomonas tetramitiformis TaxID=36881 RepID=A0AAE0BD06_9CHLO|nr:hypothetical protein CYMTET_56135 [Cymbomonas tetramitiformis]